MVFIVFTVATSVATSIEPISIYYGIKTGVDAYQEKGLVQTAWHVGALSVLESMDVPCFVGLLVSIASNFVTILIYFNQRQTSKNTTAPRGETLRKTFRH